MKEKKEVRELREEKEIIIKKKREITYKNVTEREKKL